MSGVLRSGWQFPNCVSRLHTTVRSISAAHGQVPFAVPISAIWSTPRQEKAAPVISSLGTSADVLLEGVLGPIDSAMKSFQTDLQLEWATL